MLNDPADSDFGAVEFDAEGFSGIARVFPLPAPSLFPGVVQPLHIFEERYQALMRDALDGDGLIAMAVLRPGWEIDYASRPPLESVACLGKIMAHHELEDGRFNLLLAGVRRLKMLEEIEPPEAFRRARVELIEEQQPAAGDGLAVFLRDQVVRSFRAALPHGVPPEPLQRIFESDSPLGMLVDLAAYTLPISREAKQAVLAESDVMARAKGLVDALPPLPEEPGDSGALPSQPLRPRFPPPFSEN